jgi:hypothetical protein
LSEFNAFSHEVKYKKNEVKMKNDNTFVYRQRQYKTQWDDGRQTNENITLKIKSK